jgi:hypothetical protein
MKEIKGSDASGVYLNPDSATGTVCSLDAAQRNQQDCVGRVSEA